MVDRELGTLRDDDAPRPANRREYPPPETGHFTPAELDQIIASTNAGRELSHKLEQAELDNAQQRRIEQERWDQERAERQDTQRREEEIHRETLRSSEASDRRLAEIHQTQLRVLLDANHRADDRNVSALRWRNWQGYALFIGGPLTLLTGIIGLYAGIPNSGQIISGGIALMLGSGAAALYASVRK